MGGAEGHKWLHGLSNGFRSTKKPAYAHVTITAIAQDEGRGRNDIKAFRPYIHRSSSLVALTIVVLTLVGLLEYSLHVLPQTSLDLFSSHRNVKRALIRDGERRRGGFGFSPDIQQRNDIDLTSVPTTCRGDCHIVRATDYMIPAVTTIHQLAIAHSSSPSSSPSPSPSPLPVTQISDYLDPVATTIHQLDDTLLPAPAPLQGESYGTTADPWSPTFIPPSALPKASYLEPTAATTSITAQQASDGPALGASAPKTPPAATTIGSYLSPSAKTTTIVLHESRTRDGYLVPTAVTIRQSAGAQSSTDADVEAAALPSDSYLMPSAMTAPGPSVLAPTLYFGPIAKTSMETIPVAPSTAQTGYLDPTAITIKLVNTPTPTLPAKKSTTPDYMILSSTSSRSVFLTTSRGAYLDPSATTATSKSVTGSKSTHPITTRLRTATRTTAHTSRSSRSKSTSLRTSSTATQTASSATSSTTASPSSAPVPIILDSKVPLTLVKQPVNYFLLTYFPVVMAVLLRLVFKYLYSCTKLVDPFFMLTRPGGVSHRDLLRAGYLGNEPILEPIYMLKSKRWLLLAVSAVYAGTQVITALAGELSSIYLSNYHPQTDPGEIVLVQGHAFWINTVIARIIEGILLFIAVMLVIIRLMLRKHTTGIATSPACIGTVMSLASHPATVEHILSTQSRERGAERTARRSSRRYMLDYYASKDGDQVYGIVPIQRRYHSVRVYRDNITDDTADGNAAPAPATHLSSLVASNPKRRAPSMLSRILRRFPLILFTATTIILFAMILSYFLNSEATKFEAFMDTGGFGPRILLTILTLLLKSPLLSLSASATSAIPFHRLAQRPRRAGADLLTPVPITPLGSISYAARRGQWLAMSLGVAGGLVVEILVILVPGVPYHPDQLWKAALASWYGCLACLGVFLLVAMVMWTRVIFCHRPRCRTLVALENNSSRSFSKISGPASIGAVCRYVAGSRAAADMAMAMAAAESDFREQGGEEVAARWKAEVRGAGAVYDFRPRGGILSGGAGREKRWVVEYADVVDDGEKAVLGPYYGSGGVTDAQVRQPGTLDEDWEGEGTEEEQWRNEIMGGGGGGVEEDEVQISDNDDDNDSNGESWREQQREISSRQDSREKDGSRYESVGDVGVRNGQEDMDAIIGSSLNRDYFVPEEQGRLMERRYTQLL